METQRAAPTPAAPMKPARELAALIARLPKQERLRLEGVVIGVGLAHQESEEPEQPQDSA